MPQQVLLSLYHSLIHPYLEYCNIAWALEKTTVLNSLIICQKKVIRIITHSSWRAHTEPLFQKLNILSLYNINDLQLACFVYQCINNQMPCYFNNMFKLNADVHVHNTRHKTDLHSDIRTLSVRDVQSDLLVLNYGTH